MITFQSKYFHNKHSEQRDNFLIENFGEEWLKDMKVKGYFGGDWPEELIGTLKPWKNWHSKAYDANGNIFKNREVDLDASGN